MSFQPSNNSRPRASIRSWIQPSFSAPKTNENLKWRLKAAASQTRWISRHWEQCVHIPGGSVGKRGSTGHLLPRAAGTWPRPQTPEEPTVFWQSRKKPGPQRRVWLDRFFFILWSCSWKWQIWENRWHSWHLLGRGLCWADPLSALSTTF